MNLRPFITRLKILDKQRQVVPLRLNWAQDQYITTVESMHNSGRPIRVIILKARQMGLSTATEATMFALAFLFHNTHGMVISHDQDSYEHLLGMTKRYWETFFAKQLYSTDYKSRRELAWSETGSSITTATAKTLGAGRSQTLHALHASEIAFWPDPETLLTGLRQTIPNLPSTFICLESTANGVGNYFHTQWDMAIAGDSEYTPLFFPWWKHPEYTAESARLPLTVPTKTSDERALGLYLHSQGLSRAEVDSRLVWRRYGIRDLCQNDLTKFQQEYPATPEEAFISTGRNVFPLDHLTQCHKPAEGERGYIMVRDTVPIFQQSSDGPAVVWKHPSKNRDHGRYIVAGDPTHTTRGDYACIQVLNRRTLEQVARIRIKIDPVNFAKELYAVARYYNDALLTTETTGPGYATVGALVAMGYPNLHRTIWADKTPGAISESYGFNTNVQRKNWAIGALLNAFVEHAITLHDGITFSECKNYISLDNGGYGPADHKNGFDDCVMSLAIGLLCHLQEPPLPPVGVDKPIVDIEQWMRDGTVQEKFNEMVGT